MESLLIKLKGTVNDSSLPKLDELRMKVTKRGNGVARIVASSLIGYTKLVFIDGIGKFYSDSAATQLIGSEWTIAGNKNNMTVYAKVDSDGYLGMEKASDLFRMGRVGDFNSGNHFISDFNAIVPSFSLTLHTSDIAYLTQLKGVNSGSTLQVIGKVNDFSNMLDLDVLSIRSENTLLGDANFLKNHLNLKTVSFLSPIELDLNNLSALVYCMSFPAPYAGNITYSGTSAKKFNRCTFIQIQPSIPLSIEQTDNLIISMSQSDWADNKSLQIRGTRSAASDAAVATLQGKGVTVTIIQ